MKSKIRQLACVGLTGVMLATFIAGNALAFAKDGNGVLSADRYDTVNIEDMKGKLDLTDIAIKNLNNSVLDGEASGVSVNADKKYNVIVTLEQAPIIDRVRSNSTVKEYLSSPAGASTQNAIKTSQKRFLSELSKAGVKHTLVNSYNTVTNSVVLNVKGADITKITGVSSVKSVVMSSYYDYPEAADTSSEKSSAASNPNDVYKTGIYDSSDYVKGLTDLGTIDGGEVTIAILDTGLDYTHEAFNVMPAKEVLDKTDVADLLTSTKAYSLSAANGETISENDLYINKKVPFAYDYADKDANVYPSYSQHGTHVAGIAAGNGPSDPSDPGFGYTDKDGNKVNEQFVGVAPNAQLVICKVFTDNFDSPDLGGAVTEDIINALEDCVTLGVDVINMSLGTSSGFSSIEIDGDTEGQLMNDVYAKIRDNGISLICAASNEYSSGYGSAFGTNLASNPDSGTVGSPSTFTGAMSTASINGQQSYYMNVNLNDGQKDYVEPIFFSSASNANYVRQDFLKMLGVDKEPKTFKYVVISGVGLGSSYTAEVRKQFTSVKNGGYKQEGEKVIAVIKRGTNSFQEKVEIAMRGGLEGSGEGADAVIIYNNVAGTIGISVGDIDNPVPVASVTMDAGNILTSRNKTGTLTLSADYQAGPFMNDYSSWGVTPDLKLKPDITSYGGEITSTVSGGYNEQSGTSMASPNLAGFTALLRGHLKSQGHSGTELTKLINQMIMSTATIVYNEDGKAYSPRKQGAGLATLDNVFSTGAYLYTADGENVNDTEDGRPKIELGEDEKGVGVYTLKFHVKNFGGKELAFAAKSLLMTETLSSDGLSVAEKPAYLTDIPAQWKVNGIAKAEGETFTVATGASADIEVTLTLSDAEKKYIKNTFKNGMFVEGFLTLESKTAGQCSLNLPYLGFFGDWESAPMLDYDCYEIAEFLQDASYDDVSRPKEQVWATQAFASYYNSRYVIPLGSYVYLQDENAEQIYTDMEHAAISCFNEFVGDGEKGNHMTTWRMKSLYAGLLRNAELVTYDVYNTDTGEIVKSDNVYRVNKAVSGGGSAIPAQVLLEFTPDELGLVNNGRYAMDFKFYFKAEDRNNPDYDVEENSFSMVFYVDYEAPILENASIRYYDYKENNQAKQRVYLDLNIYDNHYAQAVMLCRPDEKGESIVLATEYMTPVYNAVKNGTTAVTIEITDLVNEYKDALYIQVVDYALNYSVYQISFTNSNAAPLPDTFALAQDDKIVEENGEYVLTLGLNETHTIKLDYAGGANLSNFKWECRSGSNFVKVNNGEVFAAAVGTATVTITGKNANSIKVKVKVVNGNTKLPNPSLEFGTVVDHNESIVKAAGTVKVRSGQNFKLSLIYTPWYYPTTGKIVWESDNTDVAEVDENGNVKTFDIYSVVDENGKIKSRNAVISATLYDGDRLIARASVTLSVQDCVTMSGTTLTRYSGTGGDVVLPTDKNIMVIGEEAFKDNDNITSIVFPSTVTQISARAFKNCTALKYIYFVQKDAMPIADADLSLIMKNAFENCPNLELVDLTNVKTITVGRDAFKGCSSLKEVRRMDKIGTMVGGSFEGCTSLKQADITGLHFAGNDLFKGCTALDTVKTDYYTAIGEGMFAGCTSLVSVTINAPSIGARAFEGCSALTTVNFGSVGANLSFTIGAYAFKSCGMLSSADFFGNSVISIGDMAFAECAKLSQLKNLDISKTVLGDKVFEGSDVKYSSAVYDGTKLVLAPSVITSGFAIKAGTTEIAPYAFASSTLGAGVTTIAIPASVTKIGEGAFAHLAITSITLPSGLKEISDYAFYNADSDLRLLASVTIPASVERIGKAAFFGCDKLETLTFESGSALKAIDDEAFANCQSLTQVTLPDGCATMGDAVFYGCTSLKTVTLPSVTKMGARTFWMCTALEEATFGANATATGTYTFCPGTRYDAQGNVSVYKSSLKTVNLSDKITAVGAGVFRYCSVLETINLRNVTEVGAEAFENCTALVNVGGMETLKTIGASAFAGCASLESLNLTNAVYIGESAFHSAQFTSVSIPKAEFIGALAFYGSNATEITLPATLKTVGEAAFADSAYLKAINVAEGNNDFFSENGVLYRKVTDFVSGKTVYELNHYPSAKDSDVYAIKEGTVIVNAYAFANLNGTVRELFFPYSITAIGTMAFYNSGISVYVFECVNAPVLYSEYFDNNLSVSSLYAANFEDEFVLHTGLLTNQTASSLTIIYPENGLGYNNYVYANYFDKVTVSDEVMDNATRALKTEIESLRPIEEINAWNSLAVNAENKAMVQAFSDKVKAAHAAYNNITGAKQLELLGKDNVERLLAVENALKPVKERFGITAKATSLTVSGDSAHKTKYKEGELFDLTGLAIVVTYDDYSTETVYASSGEIKLTSAYDGVPLRPTSRYVMVSVRGITVRVAIEVTEQGAENPDADNPNGNGKLNPAVIYGPIIGVLAAAAIAVAVIFLVKKLKSAKQTETASQSAEENGNSDNNGAENN